MNEKDLIIYCLKNFRYEDGNLIRKQGCNNRHKGEIAGSIKNGSKSKKGIYKCLQIKNKKYLQHRLIFGMFNGYIPELVDHVNGDSLDNSIENLRDATSLENAQNRKDVRGVCFDKSNKKWVAYISYKRKRINLGSHKTRKDAIEARVQAEADLDFGGFNKKKIESFTYVDSRYKEPKEKSVTFKEKNNGSCKKGKHNGK